MRIATGSTTNTVTIRRTRSSVSGTSRRTITLRSSIIDVRSAEPIRRDWLGVIFGTTARRRFVVAAAIAIALHEILAALIPSAGRRTPLREIVAHAQVVRIARRHSDPPAHVTRIVRVAQAPHRIAPARRARAGAHGAPAVQPRQHRRAIAHSNGRPVWDVAIGSTVAQSAAGTASAAQGVGVQRDGTGDGTSATASDEPCGFVEFSDPHGSRYDPGSGGFYVDIRMSVHFADGSRQSLILDYPWYYANERANPWSAQNLKDPNFPTRFQAPPVDRLAHEPQLVQYVAQHSTADGMTLLRDCQGATEQPP